MLTFCPQLRVRSDVETFHLLRFGQYDKLNTGFFALIKKPEDSQTPSSINLILSNTSGDATVETIPLPPKALKTVKKVPAENSP